MNKTEIGRLDAATLKEKTEIHIALSEVFSLAKDIRLQLRVLREIESLWFD